MPSFAPSGPTSLASQLLELDVDVFAVPEVVFAVADFRVRPAPEQAVVVVGGRCGWLSVRTSPSRP